MQIVNCQILDGVCTVGSSLTHQVRCLSSVGNDVDRARWLETWGARLNTEDAVHTCHLVAFIRITGNSVVLLPNDGTHFRYTYDEGLQFALSPQLHERLRWCPTPEKEFFYSFGLPPTGSP